MPAAIVPQPARNGPTRRHSRPLSIESGMAGGAAIDEVAAKNANAAAAAGTRRGDIETPRRAKSQRYSAGRRIVGSQKYEIGTGRSPRGNWTRWALRQRGYSYRSASVGSTRDARRAGTQHASIATPPSSSAMPA